jgi:hypothetical protein
MLRRLPRRLDRIAGAAEQGRLGINVRLFADDVTAESSPAYSSRSCSLSSVRPRD